jgi:hypothetical protein
MYGSAKQQSEILELPLTFGKNNLKQGYLQDFNISEVLVFFFVVLGHDRIQYLQGG